MSVYLHKPGLLCSLGNDTDTVSRALFSARRTVLTPTEHYTPGSILPVGRVSAELDFIPGAATGDQSRNNRLLYAAYLQIAEQIDALKQAFPAHRIGVIVGTSTSGISDAEAAFEAIEKGNGMPPAFDYRQQEIGSPAQFLARQLMLSGPATTISTACSSGAKALASARRLLESDVCDAVICGGVDTLCKLTLNGFSALGAVSSDPCNPFSAHRKGINIGEAAALFVISKRPSPVSLSGCGETSDAHHISAPHPAGTGAIAAMRAALNDAGLRAADIGYINLHGTATIQNDQMESLAVNAVFGDNTPCSSTKSITGHTLGAAGALEAAFCWLTLTGSGQLPPHWWDGVIDDQLAPLSLVAPKTGLAAPPNHVLSNSFAFGGNNIAIILSKTARANH